MIPPTYTSFAIPTPPLTTNAPVIVDVLLSALLNVILPVVAPTLIVVASLAKLTVVAVVLIRLKLALSVINDVDIVGLVPNTSNPVPVSSLITPANSLELVEENTLNLFLVYVTVPPSPNATVDVSVPVNVSVLLAVNVFPLAIVNVPVVVLIVNPLIVVAVATPRVGVINVGLPSNTNLPVPVAPVEVTPSTVG